MKKHNVYILALISLSFSVTADYQIDRYTMDNGGGQCSGGVYLLSGTIGQPDTSYSAGENIEMLGGFWPGGPLCFIDFSDFAMFANQWLKIGPDLPADLDHDRDVDLNDLKMFAYEWLCLCPINWPLK